MGEFDRIAPARRDGSEPFTDSGSLVGCNLLDFWQWSVSDLASNATRGRLAEYIVARALGISTGGVRDEWAACDLCTTTGIQIEVKSAAYLQSWHQTKPSVISFSVKKSRSWDAGTNAFGSEPTRTADVYVFALLHHMEKPSLDPLNVDQWSFFAVSTKALNERERSQYSITLKSLRRLAREVRFRGLSDEVSMALVNSRDDR